jgi:hypothetical protein
MAINFRRGWPVPAGILLLLLIALWPPLREERKAGVGADIMARGEAGAPSDQAADSAAEKARREAIGALGPIKRRDGINAADLYKRAIDLYSGLTDADKEILKDVKKKPGQEAAAALYEKIRPIMDLLREARMANYADWGLGPMTVATNVGPLIDVERNLTSVALWDSSYRFSSDPSGAIGDLAALEALGRSGVDSMSIIGLALENGIHNSVINLLAENSAAITGAAGADLADILSPDAAKESFQNAMNSEASMMQGLADQIANPATQSAAVRGIGPVGAASAADVIFALGWAAQTEHALPATLAEPRAQFEQWWNQKTAEASSVPLTAPILSALAATRNMEEVSLTQSALLAAGIALGQNDQAQFESILDPSTGQPFTYTQTANGFQLGSVIQYKGKPVTLSFPTSPTAK